MGDDVGRIKARLDVVDVIGEYVRLTKSGKNYKGLCPFHDERTPSFHVSQERQSWHCFGCGKGGDLFSFVMEREGVSFPEALELLARRAGVSLEARSGKGKTSNLFDVMEAACSLFQKCLHDRQGLTAQGYLDRRDVSPESQSFFELGWAPPSWNFLTRELPKRGIALKPMERCGLVIRSERGLYDRFRGRVIFPIRDISGRLVAFGGRIIDGDGAKYLNSPETDIYSKRKTLYLIDKARAAIREKGHSILVEGYMDALRLHMKGFTQTVATLGTSLTEEQAEVLRRLADRTYICYDADGAGQAAALRGMYVLQKAGLSVWVVSLPEGEDPDDLLSASGGVERFEGCLKKALPLVEYHIRLSTPLIEDPKTRKGAISGLFDGLAQVEPVEISPHLPLLAALLGVRELEVLDALDCRRKDSRPIRSSFASEEEILPEDEAPPPLPEIAVVTLLWEEASLRKRISADKVLPFLSDSRLKRMAGAILSGESPAFLEKRWLSMNDTFPLFVLAKGGSYLDEFDHDLHWKWRHFCQILYRQKAQMRYNELRVKLLRGEADVADIQELEQVRQRLVSQKGFRA
ncbi:MAG: DNA primase [Dethiosulfovibrio peptidovorans]|nr:MAG: DNA primase [Dethiosulfovibrio peptidovorans]